jgi:hypothetical protein
VPSVIFMALDWLCTLKLGLNVAGNLTC